MQLTADFDFNRITQTSDKFDPEGRVVRSSQTREETSVHGDGQDGQVTVGNELPGAQQRQPSRSAAAPRDQNRKSEEIVNYEISRTTKTEVTEGGRVNRISVAVLVDGIYSKNDKGEVVYQPREKEEIDRIAALVRSAIGFDQKRGDQVEVVNLRFADTPATAIAGADRLDSMFLQFTKDDIMRGIELGVMVLLGLVVLLLVVRPLVRRMLASEQPAARQCRLAGGRGRRRRCCRQSASADMQAAIAAGRTPTTSRPVPSQTAKMIDIAQVQGQVHAQSVQKVGELADKNPNETVSIIRNGCMTAQPDR